MITLQNLRKDYESIRAVNDINFTIKKGEILGFLGPNGAGKSTTLKMITCFLSPTAGNILIGEKSELNVLEHSKDIRKLIGYLPEQNPLYVDMTVYDYLKFVSEIRQIPADKFKGTLKKTIKQCGLSSVISQSIKTLSKGFKQRVGIAQAIIHNPEILILDEPTTGLDANQIVEIRELIKELGREKTLIISSHILLEVQKVCDRICIIDKGSIVGSGTTEELSIANQQKVKLTLELIANPEEVKAMPETIKGITIMINSVEDDIVKVEITYPQQVDYRKVIYNHIKKENWILLEMQRHTSNLEDIFRNLTGGQNE
jgi:ABC-2 type transport system ATP-binding protein